MEPAVFFSIVSIILYFSGILPYWRDIFRGKTIPHPFSSFVWLVLTGFNSSILLWNEEYLAAAPGIITCFFLFFGTIVGLYLFQKIRINWFDYLCLILSIGALLYYFLFHNILNTVLISIGIDFLAFLPTFKKGWLQPWTETILLYILAGVSNIFALLAILDPSKETILFWLYLVIANCIFFFMVFFRRWYLKGWKSIFE